MAQKSQQINHMHIPVLLEQVLHYLDPQPGESYLDLTAGYGGHASAILQRTRAPQKTVLVDRDSFAITELEKVFGARADAGDKDQPGQGESVRILHTDFRRASQQLLAEKQATDRTDGSSSARWEAQGFDMILADLGVSSPHLDQGTRGFAITTDGPLDMRMDQSQTLTAGEIVNTYSAEQIADILKHYGEEPKARQIAQLIVQNRPLTTTTELAAIAARAWPGHSKAHPATRTFQALRIAVNDELQLVGQSLPLWIDLLAPGGRLVVISFHSLEDRLVKQAFQEAGGDWYDANLTILTKHPATASATELVSNPRARSAKLRAAVKIKNSPTT
jgi:16S rRNA (cytosine1402-N4)-methyltransferase